MRNVAKSSITFFLLFVTGSIAIEFIKERHVASIDLLPILVVGALASVFFGGIARATNA